jgi:predicted  nucleic acid-binding Zn-ribbon protein
VSKIDALLDLQAIDSVIDRLNQRLAGIKASLHETEQLIAAREAAQAAEQLVIQRRATRKDLELSNATLTDKIQQAEKRLYSGLVKNPKELLDLQNDIAALKRQKTALDDQLFAAMVAYEEAESASKQHAAEYTQLESDWRASQADLLNEQSQLEAELAQQTQEQAETRALLTAADLALYDQLRRRKGGLAVVELNGSACGGCGVRVTASVIQRLTQREDYARCGNCERMLVRP